MDEEKGILGTITQGKELDFAKISKVVLLVSSVAVAALVLHIAFCDDFGQFLPTFSDFGSSYGSINNASSPAPVPEPEPIHDEYYDLRKVLKSAATEDNTVILTTLNDAFAEPNSIFDLFLESFKIGNNTAHFTNHILVIAVDEKAYNRCQALLPHCYLFRSKINYSSEEMAHEAKFMSPIYMDMMWERQGLLLTILSFGYNFVFTDTDVMWFRDPFPQFDPDVDFQTSCDFYLGKPFDLDNFPNNGFNFVRSNIRTIMFYNFWLSSRSKYPTKHEQDVFNMIKHDPFVKQIGLKFRFLDTDYFGGFCTVSKDFNKVCTMHANCCIGLDRKIADLHIVQDDWKMYLSSTRNQTAPRPEKWRAPNKCL